jgi:hypothetical protein
MARPQGKPRATQPITGCSEITTYQLWTNRIARGSSAAQRLRPHQLGLAIPLRFIAAGELLSLGLPSAQT